MKQIFIISLFLMLLSVFSCREYIDIAVEEQDKVLVVNAFLNTDSTVSVNLSKSLGVLERNDSLEFIENAEIRLYESGEYKESLAYDKYGYYTGSFTPAAGKTYRLEASAGEFEPVTAVTRIPQPAAIKEITADFNLDTITEEWWDEENRRYFDTTVVRMTDDAVLNIRFEDPENEQNFYFVTFSILAPQYRWDEGYETLIGETMVNLDYETNTVSGENYLYMPNYSGYVFSDDFFNGQRHTFTARIYSGAFSDHSPNRSLPDSPVYVNLYSVTEDFFDFVISYSRYEEAAYNPFTEPVNVKSNVENGYGLFTGFSAAKDSVTVE